MGNYVCCRAAKEVILSLFLITSFTLQAASKESSKKSRPTPVIKYETTIPRWSLENKHQVLHLTPHHTKPSLISLGKERYTLINIHFHYPSEHCVKGKRFPLEAHFVHENSKRKLAVVSVLIQEGPDQNSFYKRLVTSIKKVLPFKAKKTTVQQTLNIEKLLPPGAPLAYLPKQPANKGLSNITWLIAKKPITLDKDQIETIKTCYRSQHHAS